ncbi:hypothetical protein INR49_003926, partial [Caranx melampygus]
MTPQVPIASISAPAAASTPADSVPSMSRNIQQPVVTGKRKRSLFKQEHMAVLREIQAEEIAQEQSHMQLLLTEAWEAREMEATLRREESAQIAAFNEAFLGLLGLLVQ